MISRTTRLLSFCAALAVSTSAMHAQDARADRSPRSDQSRANQATSQQMQNFVANHGQWPAQVKFLSRTPGLDLWVTNGSVVYDLYRTQGGSKQSQRQTASHRVGHVVRMQFVGSSDATTVQGYEQKPGYFNYLYGNRSSTNVPVFSQARIEKIYNGVDAVLYLDNGRPRYDLVLQPGADPSVINVKYEGAKGMSVNRNGELAISTTIGEVTQSGLFAYQMEEGIRKQVACSFTVKKDGSVGFTVGSYNAAKPLVIDPVISTLGYSTYLGGVGDDAINAMAVDGAHNVYVAGACSTAVFPTTPGAYDLTQNGGTDAFVFAKAQKDAPIDEATAEDYRYLGLEPDLFVNWQLTEDLTLAFRYGIFFPGSAITSDDSARQGLYLSVSYAF